MKKKSSFTRRTALKTIGVVGTAAFLSSQPESALGMSGPSRSANIQGDVRSRIFQRVDT